MGQTFTFLFASNNTTPTMGYKSIQLVVQCILPGLTPNYVEFESIDATISYVLRITVVSPHSVLSRDSIATEP